MLKSGLQWQAHQLGTRIALAMALTVAALQAPFAHSAQIEAIMGGGIVLGTECANGIVQENLYSSSAEFVDFGPDVPLYVQTSGKTRLKRTSDAFFADDDRIKFYNVQDNFLNGVVHYRDPNTGNDNGRLALFGKAGGAGDENVPQGQGAYQLRYYPRNAAPWTELGILYTVTPNADFSYSCTGPDPTPEDQTPDAPTITDLVPGNQLLTATYVAGQEHTYPIAKYQYKLDVVGGSAGTWTDITGAMPTLQQAATLQLTGLVNGTTYAVTVRAIDSQDGEGDPSNTVTDTPRIVCSDEDFPAVGTGAAASFECTHNDVTYEFSDFHILTKTSSANQCASLPHEADRTALFCKQDGTSLIAAFDWWNQSKAQLSWLQEVQQVGSRRVEEGGAPCASGSTTVSGRCRNQLYLGEFAFAGMAGVGGAGIQNLDTSNVSVAWHMFDGASDFNQPLNAATWDLSNNFYTAKMFRNASSFNQDVSWFNNRNVSDATYMFAGATAFNNGCAAGATTCPMNWADTSKVTSFGSMFLDAVTFNQDISGWNTGKVTSAENMFKGAIAFNRDISNWNVSKLVEATGMFQGARAFNQDVSSWTVSAIKNAAAMFMNAHAFNQPLGAWTLSSAQVLSSMFRGARAFNQNIGNWSTGQVLLMDYMFKDATSFDQNLSNWSVASLISKSNFDTGASAWCGLGFANRGRPVGFDPSAGERCALHVDMEAPATALAGDKISYVLTYYNESSNAISNGNLGLQLPAQVSFVAASDGGVLADSKVSWTSLEIPAGSSRALGAGQVSATVEILSTTADGSDVSAIATLSDGASLSATVTSVTQVTAKSDLAATVTAPAFAVAGQEISYELQVVNRGQVATQSGSVELAWTDSDVKPVSGGQNCSGTPLKCVWGPIVIPSRGQAWEDTVKVVLPADAEIAQIVSATLVATAENANDNSDSTASASTEINARPAIESTLRTVPVTIVKPGGSLQASVTVKNTGAGEARETQVALPIPTGAVAAIPAGATCDQNLDPCTSYLSWSLGTLAADEEQQVAATLTAPNTENSSLSLQAQISFKDSLDIRDQLTSNMVTLQVATRPIIDLAAQFSPDRFEPGGETKLQFDFANVGTNDATSGKLTFRTPDASSLKAWPQNTLCDDAQCSQGFTGVVALMLGTVAKSGETGDSGSATFGLEISEGAESLEGAGYLAPTTRLEFLPKEAAATAIPKNVDEEIDGHLIEIIPPGGSSCSLDIVESRPAYNYPGWTLVVDQLLRFTVTECEPGVTLGVRITARDSVLLPEGSIATKTSGDAGDSLRAIPGSRITGQVIEYDLTDNDGDLDLDPRDGELEDPLSVALVGGSGIYVPYIPVPIPYWVLGLLAGLMGWLGFQRLSAA